MRKYIDAWLFTLSLFPSIAREREREGDVMKWSDGRTIWVLMDNC